MTWNIFRGGSLKTRVTLFTLAIFLLGLWSLAFYATRMLRGDMQRLLGEQQFSTASFVAEEVDHELEDRFRALETVAGSVSPAVLGNMAALQAFLEQRLVFQGLFNGGIIVTRLDGTAIAEVPLSARRIGVNYMDRGFMAAALKEGKAAIGRPVMGRRLQAPVFGMSAPIRDAQGRVIGALAGVVNLGMPSFLDKLTGSHYGRTGGYLLVSPQDRLIVTASDKRRVMEELPAFGIIPLIERRIQGQEGADVFVNPRGEEVLSSAKGIPVTGWLAVVSLPIEEAFAPIRAMQQRMLLATIFLTLLAGGLTWWMLRRQLAPMLATVKTLATLSDSNQPLQPLPIARQDEVGQLIGGFNRLLETLGKREEAFKESEWRFRCLTEMSSDFYWESDIEHRLTTRGWADKESSSVTVFQRRVEIGERRWEIPSLSPDEAGWRAHRALLGAHLPFRNFEISRLGTDGTERHISVSGDPVFDAAGNFEGYRGVATDITERKRADEALRESQARYVRAVNGANDGIWEWIPATGENYLSPRWKQLLDFEDHELPNVRASFYSQLHPEDESLVREAIRAQLEERKPYSVELRLRCKSGEYRWFLSRGQAEWDEQGRPLRMAGSISDITERKRVERELQHKTEIAQLSAQLARAANEAVSPESAMETCLARICEHGKWALGRVATLPPESHYKPEQSYWFCTDSARFAAFMRYSEGFAYLPNTGKFVSVVLRERSPVWLPDLTALDSSESDRMMAAAVTGIKAAFAFPVIVRGEVAAFLEFFATETRQPDALLIEGISGLASQFARLIERRTADEASARFAAIVENSTDAIIGRAVDGTITAWNAAAERILGYTAAEAIGRELPEIQPPDLGEEGVDQRKRVLAGESDVAWDTVRIAKDGRRIDVAISASAIKDSSRRIIGTAVIVRDITERKCLEEAHLRSQKLESLGTLAGGIAHDFNNILAAIRGNADLASHDVGPDHLATQSLEEIRKACVRAGELVRRIMAFGRPREAQQQVADLGAVVGEVLKLLRSTLPAGISLNRAFAKDTPQVLADAGQIHEAVVNLTTNAGYAIGPRAGSIEYRLEPVQVEEKLARGIPGLKLGRYACLTVTDSGCGMDAATLERVFDAFYTTKPVGEGTGLGLSMVHGIMRSHGGAVTVESAPGKGSSFHLYFPAARQQTVKKDASAPAQSLLNAGRRVLYVDDEEALVFLANRFLSRLGHSISGFTDPEAALEAFRAHPQDYDVVVSDLSMPKMSGFDLVREVLAVRPGMPVLMTSGYIRAADEERARAAGIREVILKPTTMDELASVLDRLFRDSQARSCNQVSV